MTTILDNKKSTQNLTSDSLKSYKMDELSDFSGEVVEFKPLVSWQKQQKLVDNCTATEILPLTKDISSETNPKKHVETQTQTFISSENSKVDEKNLALWLRKIYPSLEAEILKGPTPIIESCIRNTSFAPEELNIQPYQKIVFGSGAVQLDNSQGLATWLSLHTNNAPVLVLTTMAPHDDWCEHVNQSIRIFTPKRAEMTNFVMFSETKTIPIKSCLKVLATNAYNKSIFAGSTLDGDVYIWGFEQSSGEVKMLFNFTAPHGYATAMDWPAENRLLTCHSNGCITQWLISKQVAKETDFLLQAPFTPAATSTSPMTSTTNDITTLVCLSPNDFVVGTKDGCVYHCWTSNVGSVKRQLEITPLRRHLFMVSSLLKTKIPGYIVVISCDLSGQVFYHDIRNADDDSANVIVQIPLPFKNSIACSRDGNVIYCPGIDGSLECFSLRSGIHSFIKGALRGKGSLIKCSDNGNWIVTGLYNDEFQIFYVEN